MKQLRDKVTLHLGGVLLSQMWELYPIEGGERG